MAVANKDYLKIVGIAVVAIIIISAIFVLLGVQQPQQKGNDQNNPENLQEGNANGGTTQGFAATTVDYDPASNIGGRIADSTSNPVKNIPLNPFSD